MNNEVYDLTTLRRLRVMAVIEGSTLVGLVVLAVPLKHLFGIPIAVRIMGPVHGTAFVAYGWALTAAVSAGGWKRREIVRLAIGALIPFASFVNERWLGRKERALLAGARL